MGSMLPLAMSTAFLGECSLSDSEGKTKLLQDKVYNSVDVAHSLKLEQLYQS